MRSGFSPSRDAAAFTLQLPGHQKWEGGVKACQTFNLRGPGGARLTSERATVHPCVGRQPTFHVEIQGTRNFGVSVLLLFSAALGLSRRP